MDGPDTAQRSPAYDAGHRWGSHSPVDHLTEQQREQRLRHLLTLAEDARERADRFAGRAAGFAQAIADAELADHDARTRAGAVLRLDNHRRRAADHTAAREAQG